MEVSGQLHAPADLSLRKLGGPQSRFGNDDEETSLLLPGIESRPSNL